MWYSANTGPGLSVDLSGTSGRYERGLIVDQGRPSGHPGLELIVDLCRSSGRPEPGLIVDLCQPSGRHGPGLIVDCRPGSCFSQSTFDRPVISGNFVDVWQFSHLPKTRSDRA